MNLLIASVFLFPTFGASQANADLLLKGLQCVASQQWAKDDLRELGLFPGKTAIIRYRRGPIPGTSPQNPQIVNIIIYSDDQKRGWMLFFRQHKDGTVSAIRNGYRLISGSKGWSANEGNGGVATYAAIGVFADQVSKQPPHRIKIGSGKGRCPVE